MLKTGIPMVRTFCIAGGLFLNSLQALADEPTENWLPVENVPECSMAAALGVLGAHPTWSGACKQGKLHGPGFLSFDDGNLKLIVEGTFETGHPLGKALLHVESVSDTSQRGALTLTFNNGALMSTGAYVMPDGTRYDGEWKGFTPHGRGVKVYPDGRRYEGEFVNGVETGQGVMITPDGTRFEGQFTDGFLSGPGKIIFSNGTDYEGVFENGFIVGVGKKTFSDGSYYEGEFNAGAMSGHGVMHVTDQKSCEGEWAKDRLVGTGEAVVGGMRQKCRMENRAIQFFE